MVEKIKVNPHYVSSLLGPLALAVATDEGGEVLSLVDYSSKEQSRLVISSLIAPNFKRLKDSTRFQVAKALAHFSGQPNVSSEIVEAKLLLCEIPPAYHLSFLRALWEVLFPGESAEAMAEGIVGIVNRPLNAMEFAFDQKPTATLDELIEEFRVRSQV